VRINFFKQRQNRRYNYTPRYFKGKKDENLYDFDSPFSKYRDIPNANDFGAHWREARSQSRNRGNKGFSKLFLFILTILVLLALYVLDFDLSIFKK
jgi:hypothetical protein